MMDRTQQVPPVGAQPPDGRKVSYAQQGEDLAIIQALTRLGITTPSYLDIGAFHPTIASNTYLLYLLGGRGVVVEPNPLVTDLLRRDRPGDTVVVAGISVDGRTEADYYVIRDRPQLNTFSQRQVQRYIAEHGDDSIVQERVTTPLVTLNQLLATHFPQQPPDLLSVDIEGHDLAALRTLDFTRWRPAVICVETAVFGQPGIDTAIFDLMAQHDYAARGGSMTNTIFIDSQRERQIRTGWRPVTHANPELQAWRASATAARRPTGVRVLHFFGLKRSGNHAIINWIRQGLAQPDAPCPHFNNVHDIYQYPADRRDVSAQDIAARLRREGAANGLVSYEDLCVDCRHTIPQYRALHDHALDVILLRDFPNMAASRHRRIEHLAGEGLRRAIRNVSWLTVLDLWKRYARAVLAAPTQADTVGIVYNDWYRDRATRDAIAAQLGFTNHDLAVRDVPSTGRGSSFDGTRYHGSAEAMDVLARWQQVADQPWLRELLIDPELDDLHHRLFGYGTKDLTP